MRLPCSYPPPAATAPPGSISGAWDQVMRFLDEGIVPAARAVLGAAVQVPAPEDLFLGDLPTDVAAQREILAGRQEDAPARSRRGGPLA